MPGETLATHSLGGGGGGGLTSAATISSRDDEETKDVRPQHLRTRRTDAIPHHRMLSFLDPP